MVGTCSNSNDWEFWHFYVHIPRKISTRDEWGNRLKGWRGQFLSSAFKWVLSRSFRKETEGLWWWWKHQGRPTHKAESSRALWCSNIRAGVLHFALCFTALHQHLYLAVPEIRVWFNTFLVSQSIVASPKWQSRPALGVKPSVTTKRGFNVRSCYIRSSTH